MPRKDRRRPRAERGRWGKGRPSTVREEEGRRARVFGRGRVCSRRWRGWRVEVGGRGEKRGERALDPRRSVDRVTWIVESPETLTHLEGRWSAWVVRRLWVPRGLGHLRWRRKPGLRAREWTRVWRVASVLIRGRGTRWRERPQAVRAVEDLYVDAARVTVQEAQGVPTYRSLRLEEGEIQGSRRGQVKGLRGSLEREALRRVYGVRRWRGVGDSLGGDHALPSRSQRERREEERRPRLALWHRGLAFLMSSSVRNRLDLFLLLRRRTERGRGSARRQRVLSETQGAPVYHRGESRLVGGARGFFRRARFA